MTEEVVSEYENEEVTEEIEAEPDDATYWQFISEIFFNPLFGWSVLALAIIILILWNKIHHFLDRMYEKRQQIEYDAKCHKDPDWVLSHHEKMESARRKMQEKYNLQAAEHQVKVAEREKQKNLEKLTKCVPNDEGHRLGSESSPRPEYSPLDGDGGGRYRPPKRSKCSGGGCG